MKTVLVTGSSRGIGRALALSFGGAGYRVAVHCVSAKDQAEEVARQIPEAFAIAADVRKSEEVQRMIAAVIERWGRLDIQINNAGVSRDRRLIEMTDEEWSDLIDVNLTGAFYCLREGARVMKDQKSGHIINIASRVAFTAPEGAANYAASKAGLLALTKTAARELGRFGVRVNAVLPGFHLTGLGATLSEKTRERIQGEHLLGRSTTTEDLCRFVLNLAENDSVSGQIFNVDNRMI